LPYRFEICLSGDGVLGYQCKQTKEFFMSSPPPYQSRLIPYQKEIFRMWYNERATLKTIQESLDKKSVSISLSALSRFIKRRQFRSNFHDAPKTKTKRLVQSNQNRALEELEKLMEEETTCRLQK